MELPNHQLIEFGGQNLSNDSTQNTGSEIEFESLWILAVKTAVAFIGIGMILATIVGNVLVCVAIRSERSLQLVQNVLLVSLAASDILIGVLVLPLGLIYTLLGYWPFYMWLCEVWLVADVLGCTASILNLCIISIDRYLSIRIPFEYSVRRNYNLMYGLIAGCWILSLVIALPPILGVFEGEPEPPQTTLHPPTNVEELHDAENQCMQPIHVSEYVIYSILFSFYIPNSIMVFVYVNIYKLAMKRISTKTRVSKHQFQLMPLEKNNNDTNNKNAVKNGVAKNGNGNGGKKKSDNTDSNSRTSPEKSPPGLKITVEANDVLPPSSSHKTTTNEASSSQEDCKKVTEASPCLDKSPPGNKSCSPAAENKVVNQMAALAREKYKAQKEKERRAIIVLGVVMVTFLACWLPFFVYYPIISLCGEKCNNRITMTFLEIFTFLGWLNSALNPVIYTIFNMEFRNAFRRILSPLLNKFKR